LIPIKWRLASAVQHADAATCGRPLGGAGMTRADSQIAWFEELRRGDVPRVGGKNASLGEMVQELGSKGISVPAGFATTADAYWSFVEHNALREHIAVRLAAWNGGQATLAQTGEAIRGLFLASSFPAELARAIRSSYQELARRAGRDDVDVAVRSSATAGTCRMRVLPASRKRSSTYGVETHCWPPAVGALRRSSPTAPSPIARPRALTT
jgi:hypothetical protein